MSLTTLLYLAITVFFDVAVLRRYLRDELLLSGASTLLVLIPNVIAQPICRFFFGGICGLALFAISAYQIHKRLPQKYIPQDGAYVFISGCDSGFGFATAKALDAKGVNVIAGCLFKGGDGERNLVQSCSDRLVTIQLDVTSEESVKNAVADVKKSLEGKALWGLVNNAGILYSGEVEVMSMKYFQKLMDVNFHGTLRLTKAFLPLLRASKGRIVTIVSVASEGPFPYGAGYAATKAALKITMDTLRLEMLKWGVQVSTIHPSAYYTGLTESEKLERNLLVVLDDMDPALTTEYGARYRAASLKALTTHQFPIPTDLSPVINAIEHALFAKNPLAYYLTDGFGRILAWLVLLLPVKLSKYLYGSLIVPASTLGEEISHN